MEKKIPWVAFGVWEGKTPPPSTRDGPASARKKKKFGTNGRVVWSCSSSSCGGGAITHREVRRQHNLFIQLPFSARFVRLCSTLWDFVGSRMSSTNSKNKKEHRCSFIFSPLRLVHTEQKRCESQRKQPPAQCGRRGPRLSPQLSQRSVLPVLVFDYICFVSSKSVQCEPAFRRFSKSLLPNTLPPRPLKVETNRLLCRIHPLLEASLSLSQS